MRARALYVVACVVVPLLWGLLTWAITHAIEKRRPPKPVDKKAMPELEYYL
jgi:hypothetical protein